MVRSADLAGTFGGDRRCAVSGHRFPARYPARIDLEQTFRPCVLPRDTAPH